MREIMMFQADDGKIFDDLLKCMSYEAEIFHPALFSISFFDKDNNLYRIQKGDVFDEAIYDKAEKIVITSNEELEDLHWYTGETGWCEFEQIDSVGTWKRIPLRDYPMYYCEGEWVKEGSE